VQARKQQGLELPRADFFTYDSGKSLDQRDRERHQGQGCSVEFSWAVRQEGDSSQVASLPSGRCRLINLASCALDIAPCLDSELTEFPLRMRDWLKNVLVTLYERDEGNNLLTEKQKLRVSDLLPAWTAVPAIHLPGVC
jgi:hypothetical protein